MKIYTRTGDAGETALFGGGRVPKSHLRVRAYGHVDELNSLLGRALRAVEVPSSRERLARVQHDLFSLGSHLATPPAREGRIRPEVPPLPEARITEMEAWMDEADEALPALKSFILPGGCAGSAELHLCRTVCRRAERTVVELLPLDPDVEPVIRYLNRLSDLFFVLARLENRRAGVDDVRWEQGRGGAPRGVGVAEDVGGAGGDGGGDGDERASGDADQEGAAEDGAARGEGPADRSGAADENDRPDGSGSP